MVFIGKKIDHLILTVLRQKFHWEFAGLNFPCNSVFVEEGYEDGKIAPSGVPSSLP
jgi:hypothetical protein